MSQSFDLSGVTTITHNGADITKLMLDNVRIWERYTTTEQVLVSSGYYSTSLVYVTQAYSSTWKVNRWATDREAWKHYANYSGGLANYLNYTSGATISPPTIWSGIYRYTRGSYRGANRSGRWHYYGIVIHKNVTSWVDTSSYETQTATAYYY